ncbi:MAG: hypothetical protein IPM56_12650 [Ignavibacteriales bacterium]|nr:MAG: hypothetical protein IPM56_12650 [Ignavibacteriales bacterium]
MQSHWYTFFSSTLLQRCNRIITDFLYVILLLIVLSSPIISQSANIRFDHLTTEDGLSQSTVFSIVQDRKGFMWFGTQDGLNLYDGYKFKIFRPDALDSASVNDLGIRNLFVDHNGTLWVLGLSGNICSYNSDDNTFNHHLITAENKSDLKAIRIISVAEDTQNNLWLISTSGKLFKHDSTLKRFVEVRYNFDDDINVDNLHVQCAYADSKNNIWFGTWEGVLRFDISKNTLHSFEDTKGKKIELGGSTVFDIKEDVTRCLWFASADGGISRFHPETSALEIFRANKNETNSLPSDRIMKILPDDEGIWIGTIDAGLCYLNMNDKNVTTYKYNPSVSWSISNGAIMSLYKDNSGGLWIGTSSGGVNRFDKRKQKFGYISHNSEDKTSLSHNTVLSICEDTDGGLWIGTDGGGLNYKPALSEKFEKYLTNPVSVGSNSITALCTDTRGRIWIGTDPGVNSKAGAVFIYDRKKKSLSHFKKFKINLGGVSAMLAGSNDEIWIGTVNEGLFKVNLNTEIIENFRSIKDDENSIGGNSVFSIYEDREGMIWIGTHNKGVSRLDTKSGKVNRFVLKEKDSSSINSNTVWCFNEDDNGTLWIGTWGGGLNSFDKKTEKFTHYTIRHGLPSNVVYSIITDSSGNLWLGTSKGLCKFNPSTQSIRNYNKSEGLPFSEFTQGSSLKSYDGKFYFGGNNGIIFFNPDEISDNSFTPPVVITGFELFNKPYFLSQSIPNGTEIKLDYDQNFFSFEFAALDYSATGKNQYEFMLEGIDKHWLRSRQTNIAYYTDIKPGKYVFRVKGSNSDGIWNPTDTRVTVIISSPFWATWWFRSISILILISLAYSFYRYRLNRLLEIERTRNKIAKDLHDDVSATLTGIVYFSDAISKELGEEKTPLLSKLISLIHDSASTVQDSMSDIIWSINPENDDWNKFLPKLRRYASDLCESKSIRYNINIFELPQKLKRLDMERRRNLWLIFKEMITNSVKHSCCKMIEINIELSGSEIILQMKDDGKGFDKSVLSEGNGLKNIFSRAKLLNGNVELTTSQGNGANWKLKFPL